MCNPTVVYTIVTPTAPLTVTANISCDEAIAGGNFPSGSQTERTSSPNETYDAAKATAITVIDFPYETAVAPKESFAGGDLPLENKNDSNKVCSITYMKL